VKVAIGTSTCGVRMPSMALPNASRAIVIGGPALTARRGAGLGAFPRVTQRSSAAKAALTMKR